MDIFAAAVSTKDDYYEDFAYLESEALCPFCGESTWKHIESDIEGCYYKCGLCGGEWSVLEE